jgi:hypothetical protein
MFIIALLLTLAAFTLILLSEAVWLVLRHAPEKLPRRIIQAKRQILRQMEGRLRQEV